MSFFHKPKFRRALGGYKKKDVDEFLLRTEQECDLFEDNYEKRIALLVQENEQAAQMIRILQENEARLSSDNEEYRKQLKDNKSMLQTLADEYGAKTQAIAGRIEAPEKNGE